MPRSEDASTPEVDTASTSAARPLSRARVLGVALDLVDREGLAALTMRRLAADLGVEPMAIYRHVANKEDLLDGLVDQVFDSIAVNVTAADWRGQLHGFAEALRDRTLAHPQVLPLIATRPLVVPLARRPRAVLLRTEEVLELMHRAGLADNRAVAAYRRFMGYVLGMLLVELRNSVDNPDEVEPALRLGLHRLPPAEFPRLRELAPSIGTYDALEDLHRGLDAILNAIAAEAGHTT